MHVQSGPRLIPTVGPPIPSIRPTVPAVVAPINAAVDTTLMAVSRPGACGKECAGPSRGGHEQERPDNMMGRNE